MNTQIEAVKIAYNHYRKTRKGNRLCSCTAPYSIYLYLKYRDENIKGLIKSWYIGCNGKRGVFELLDYTPHENGCAIMFSDWYFIGFENEIPVAECSNFIQFWRIYKEIFYLQIEALEEAKKQKELNEIFPIISLNR